MKKNPGERKNKLKYEQKHSKQPRKTWTFEEKLWWKEEKVEHMKKNPAKSQEKAEYMKKSRGERKNKLKYEQKHSKQLRKTWTFKEKLWWKEEKVEHMKKKTAKKQEKAEYMKTSHGERENRLNMCVVPFCCNFSIFMGVLVFTQKMHIKHWQYTNHVEIAWRYRR